MSETCGRCGREAEFLSASIDNQPYCHEGEDTSPTCYELAVNPMLSFVELEADRNAAKPEVVANIVGEMNWDES